MAKTNIKMRDETKRVLKEKSIKQEIARVKKLYRELPKEKMKILEGLITEAAFMKISLEELREELSTGFIEEFIQGDQRFNREKPESKVYTTLVQRYANSMKQLIDLMPGEEKKVEADALVEFLSKGKIKK